MPSEPYRGACQSMSVTPSTLAALPRRTVDSPGRLNVVNARTASFDEGLKMPHSLSGVISVLQPGGARNFTYGCSAVIELLFAPCCGVGAGDFTVFAVSLLPVSAAFFAARALRQRHVTHPPPPRTMTATITMSTIIATLLPPFWGGGGMGAIGG